MRLLQRCWWHGRSGGHFKQWASFLVPERSKQSSMVHVTHMVWRRAGTTKGRRHGRRRRCKTSKGVTADGPHRPPAPQAAGGGCKPLRQLLCSAWGRRGRLVEHLPLDQVKRGSTHIGEFSSQPDQYNSQAQCPLPAKSGVTEQGARSQRGSEAAGGCKASSGLDARLPCGGGAKQAVHRRVE